MRQVECGITTGYEAKRAITASPNGAKFTGRPRIDPYPEMVTNPPKICRQRTVTVHPHNGAAYHQDRRNGSPEQTDIYNVLRQAQEEFHGFATDDVQDEGPVALTRP